MAKMYPEWISTEQREANPKFRAEFKVYDLLERSLSDDWYVFYSRTWTWVENISHRVRTREADFIIAHPDFGILLLEVKGGGIEVIDGKWVSIDKFGNEWEINPYEQVAIATSSLERRLNDEPINPFRGFRFSTAVCFPDVNISSQKNFLTPKLISVTIDANRLAEIRSALIEIMRDDDGKFDAPGEPRILMLKELVACSWYINTPKAIQISDTENDIKRLTDQQFKLLYQLAPTNKRLLVTGIAGSGKTMLAAETARRMVNLDKKRVLFTCYNRNLANWVRSSQFFVDNGLMLVSNYQKLCADFAKSAGVPLPEPVQGTYEEKDPILKELFPNILLQVAETNSEQFDAIIVDEGQDFYDTWWLPLLLLLKKDGSFHVYYDSKQQLWGPPRNLPCEVMDGASAIDLTENVRNTKPIHDLAMNFHPSHGKGYKALCNTGINPEFVPIQQSEKEHQAVRRVIDQLVNEEKVSPQDIAILTPLSLVRGNSYWKPNQTLLGKYRLVHNIFISPNQLFVSSVGAAKGLEFPVVILTELFSPAIAQEVADYPSTLYVGISRARSHIIVIADRSDFERLGVSM